MNVKLVITGTLGALAFFSLPAWSFADDPSGKYPDRIKTRQEAARLPIGTSLAIECKACKTVIDTIADPKRTYLSWSDPRETHNCPNCGGKLVFKSSDAAGSGYTHACTHCGVRSAFACAEHGQHSKE